MRPSRILLGVLVTIIWGLNFSLIKVAEETFAPLLLATLRFILCCVPAIFFFPRPRVAMKYILAYGLVFGVCQFGLLFAGIEAGLSAGLSSVVLQVQVFFTILFGVLLMKEKIGRYQIVGIVVGFLGVGLIALGIGGSVSIAGLLLVAGAGVSWGLANVITKKAKAPNPVAFMVWSSAVPIIPLALLTLMFEGVGSVETSFDNLTWMAAGSLLYLVYAVNVRDASQIPALSSGALVLGLVFGMLATVGGIETYRAARTTRPARSFLAAVLGGVAGLVALACFAAAAILAILSRAP